MTKWTQLEYKVRLKEWEIDKEACVLSKSAVPPHPDEDERSPNWLNLDQYSFWQGINVAYYHIFPELAEEHGWLIEEHRYGRKNELPGETNSDQEVCGK